MNNKRILIIHTGGTIGMVKSDKGYVPAGSLKPQLEAIPELKSGLMPQWELTEFDPLLDSSNINVHQWNIIGKTINDNYDRFDGFVVLHGTDTMAYSASAISFMLENLGKPVVFTGAQIPLCEPRNDGRDNLINSIIIATYDCLHEVCLYFDGLLLRGNRSTKQSCDSFRAFGSPNEFPLAEVGIDVKFNHGLLLPKCEKPLKFQPFEEIPIGVLKVFPGIQFDLFKSIMTEKLKGIVLETFGSGNIPSSNGALLPIIKKAYEGGTIMTICSQCGQGRVTLGAYETSSSLQAVGAVSGKDMTTEAAVTKLYYLFSREKTKEAVKEKMSMNLRGELTP